MKIRENTRHMNAPLSASDIPSGFTFSATHCGIKRSRLDLGILVSDTPASAAAVFTTNQVVAAPVILSREHVRKSRDRMRGLIVNSGNANCCTKEDGYPASFATASKFAGQLGAIDPSQILVCSTGVIGAPLRVEKILAAVPHLTLTRSAEPAAFEEFARSIMTTDTRPKWAAARCRIGGKEVRLLGCAKGSGMIQPNMATMLAFIATNAAISPALLSRALRNVVHSTFNSITVDGDTSTNDTVAILANGASGAPRISKARGADYEHFVAGLESVCTSLALSIVDDGEGAQRVIEIEVKGAPSDRAADQIARTVANSPLVKTAFA
jgi:glutamate N-acetyltransferase/amino-acid N-acetyltransferase